MSPKPDASGRGRQLRKPLRNWDAPAMPDELQAPDERGLAGRLAELAGVEIEELDIDDDALARWNATVTSSGRVSFEHRVLLGIAITRRRPEWGTVGEYQAEVGESLDRSVRWIQATTRVSSAVSSAFTDGVVLPLEICDMAWSSIPGAITNLRNGRSLDWKPQKEVREPTAEEQEAAVAKALEVLKKALGEVVDAARRAALAGEVTEEMGAFVVTEVVDEGEAEDEGNVEPIVTDADEERSGAPEPEPPAPAPVRPQPDRPDRGDRPQRPRRPGRGRRRR
jgi:hypothetical protein